jgi:FKBP12-rapamycin complex-associated protein
MTLGPEGAAAPAEALGDKAVAVIQRVQDKLSGRDFGNLDPFDVNEQVDRLICQATSTENLCQLFTGWV